MKKVLLLESMDLIQYRIKKLIEANNLSIELIVYSSFVDVERRINLKNESFDLYLLDMDLGEGILPIIKKIKKKDLNNKIILMSSYNSRDEFVRGLKLGVDDFIVKPFQDERVYRSLSKFLSSKSKNNVVSKKYYRNFEEDIVLELKRARKGKYPISFTLIHFVSSESLKLATLFMKKFLKILWDTDQAFFYHNDVLLSMHPFAPVDTTHIIEDKIHNIFEMLKEEIYFVQDSQIKIDFISYPRDIESFERLKEIIDESLEESNT